MGCNISIQNRVQWLCSLSPQDLSVPATHKDAVDTLIEARASSLINSSLLPNFKMSKRSDPEHSFWAHRSVLILQSSCWELFFKNHLNSEIPDWTELGDKDVNLPYKEVVDYFYLGDKEREGFVIDKDMEELLQYLEVAHLWEIRQLVAHLDNLLSQKSMLFQTSIES